MSENLTKEQSAMKATVFKITGKGGTQTEVPGWIVPETDGLFAVDERWPACIEECEPATWKVTHLPTGFSVTYGWLTDADTKERAADIAKAFYREYKERGFPLDITDPAAFVVPYKALSPDERKTFWLKVTGIAL